MGWRAGAYVAARWRDPAAARSTRPAGSASGLSRCLDRRPTVSQPRAPRSSQCAGAGAFRIRAERFSHSFSGLASLDRLPPRGVGVRGGAKALNRLEKPLVELPRGMHDARSVLGTWDQDSVHEVRGSCHHHRFARCTRDSGFARGTRGAGLQSRESQIQNPKSLSE